MKSTPDPATQQEMRGRRPVIGAAGTVFGRTAAKFRIGHDQHPVPQTCRQH